MAEQYETRARVTLLSELASEAAIAESVRVQHRQGAGMRRAVAVPVQQQRRRLEWRERQALQSGLQAKETAV